MSASLEGNLAATVEDDCVVFAFFVENTGSDAVDLEFRSAQRFDVVVDRDSGTTVWQLSAGQMFAQVLGSETLSPGEHLVWEAEWTDPETGDYEATASLEARNADCEATTIFSV
jgi:archaellum component FlaG (FlaF/FlaG flagellin family)